MPQRRTVGLTPSSARYVVVEGSTPSSSAMARASGYPVRPIETQYPTT